MYMFPGCSSDESEQANSAMDHDQAVKAYQCGNKASDSAMRSFDKKNNSSQQLQWDLAVQSYKQAIKFDSKFPDAHYALGGAYHNLKRYTEAVKSYKQAIGISPKYSEAYFGLAASLSSLDRNEEAVDALKVVIKLKPKFAEAHYLLACVYAKLGSINDALASYDRAVDIEPDYAEPPYGPSSLYSALRKESINDNSKKPEPEKK